ncbi:MAG: condensation domain-containing protein, partial [Chloroflexota bacterium]
LEAGDLDAQKTYWLEQLKGLPAAPMLPRDFAAAPLRRPPLTHRFTEIDAALAARLHELARAHGATLYMTLLAALDMWLASVTRQTDIVVGSALSGRTREELEGVFGVLWNPVALRVDLSGNPSYSQVLERARAAALGAYANQEYPFDLVVNNLRDRRGGAGDPYSVVLVVQNASEIAATFDGVDARLSRSDFLLAGRDPAAEKMGDELREAYDLHIEIFDIGVGLRAVTRYNPMRFLPETIDSFLNQFVAILRLVVADPQVRLSQLESCASPDLDDLFEDGSGIA